jgi:fibronectin type 3 domain-containing protein/regulation of enolase protein 1 (concanavalin A-like superfamily)
MYSPDKSANVGPLPASHPWLFSFKAISMGLLFALLCSWRAEAGGTWTALNNAPPSGGVNNCLLMSDGTVLAMNGNGQCFRLTPDIHGSYINGTWTTLTSMNDSRLFFSSDLLTNGNVYVCGGEYGTGGDYAELYDSLANTWTVIPGPSGVFFSDAASKLLPNGNVLQSDSQSAYYIYNAVSNTLQYGGSCQDMNETCWVRLPNDNVLAMTGYSTTSEHYVPSLNAWYADGNSPVTLFGYGAELGASFVLPNGNVFQIGGTTNTAIYTPGATLTSAGSWVAGPAMVFGTNQLGAVDAPAAMMADGNVLLCIGPIGDFNSPCFFYEYNYVSNNFTQVGAPGGGSTYGAQPFGTSMLCLPDGSVLFVGGQNSSSLYVYTPDGTPLAAGQPSISSITENTDGSYHLTGVGLAGISAGAAYGDDEQMDGNYPLVRMTNNSTLNIYYARTYGWSSTTIQNPNPVTTEFTLPPNLPAGTYSLVVSAVGNASAPQTFNYAPPSVPTGFNATAGNTQITLSWNSVSGATAYDVLSSTTSGGPYYVPLATVTGTSYTNTGLINGFTNYYVVKAVGSGGPSGYSSQIGVAPIGPPPVPSGLAVPQAASTLVNLSWNASYGATNYNVQRSTTNGGTYAIIGTTTGTNYNDTSATIGTIYYYVVSAVGPNGTSSNSLQVTAMALPPPWVTSDVGDVGTIGDALYSGGVWTVYGSGLAIVGTADQFRYVYQPLNGDCDIRARVPSQQNTAQFAVAGVMIRETLDSGGAFAATYITPSNGFHFKYRPSDGTNSPTSANGNSLNAPPNNWVRVTRANNTFTGYSSADGVNWTQISSTTFSMATNYYVGLVVCSYTSTLATDAFDNVSVMGTAPAPAAPTGLSVTATNTQVSLTWNLSLGATNYNIKRSTSSGAETTVASTTAASYLDTGLASGTTYYYVVSAVGVGGESPNSSEVSATPGSTITLHDAPVGITNTLGSTSISKSFTVSSGANVLVVVLLDKSSSSTGVAPSTLSWNGQTLTRAVTTVDTGSIYRDASVYYLYNPTAGTANITGTLTGTPVCTYLEAYTLSGVDTNAAPATGATNSVSGTNLTFTVTAAANSWAAVGGILGAYGVNGVAVTGTGGDASGVYYGNDTSSDNCAFAFGYLSGLTGGTDTVAYSWNLTGRTPTANAFAAAVFSPGQITLPLLSPQITGISLSGTTLSLSATNGTAGGSWTLLQSADLTLPLSQWETNSTGNFDGNGNLSTNIVNTATNGQEFYILKVQ